MVGGWAISAAANFGQPGEARREEAIQPRVAAFCHGAGIPLGSVLDALRGVGVTSRQGNLLLPSITAQEPMTPQGERCMAAHGALDARFPADGKYPSVKGPVRESFSLSFTAQGPTLPAASFGSDREGSGPLGSRGKRLEPLLLLPAHMDEAGWPPRVSSQCPGEAWRMSAFIEMPLDVPVAGIA